MLAREGLTDEPSQGEDILMKDMGFGVSQRLERERLKFGREQQISKTIEQLKSINRVKVLLAIPRENIFARREKILQLQSFLPCNELKFFRKKKLMLLLILHLIGIKKVHGGN